MFLDSHHILPASRFYKNRFRHAKRQSAIEESEWLCSNGQLYLYCTPLIKPTYYNIVHSIVQLQDMVIYVESADAVAT